MIGWQEDVAAGPGFVCPVCHTQVAGDDALAGFCATCAAARRMAFTGLCAVGRYQETLRNEQGWHPQCPEPGTNPWAIQIPAGGTLDVLFCQTHSGQALVAPLISGRPRYQLGLKPR